MLLPIVLSVICTLITVYLMESVIRNIYGHTRVFIFPYNFIIGGVGGAVFVYVLFGGGPLVLVGFLCLGVTNIIFGAMVLRKFSWEAPWKNSQDD